jgi:hypothetical protein
MTNYFDLGTHSYPISTRSGEAQLWFDRGLVWCYGFNHEEAVRCFEKTVEFDPQCAMGYWGIAYASGSFYNKPWDWYGDDERIQAVKACYDYVQKALGLIAGTTASELQLIAALGIKYQAEQTDNLIELEQWEQDYSNSMRALQHNFPHDLDITCLTAEAMMNLTRWKLWDIQKGIPAAEAHTEESSKIL